MSKSLLNLLINIQTQSVNIIANANKHPWEEKLLNEKRLKYCPRCGSARVRWASGLPQLWSIWECPECSYRGAFILENGELAAKLREDYSKKTGKKVDV